MSSGIQAFNEGYVRTLWETGDVITAERLNAMMPVEPMIVTTTYDDGSIILDKTWKEIADAYTSDIPVFIDDSQGVDNVVSLLAVTSVYGGYGAYNVVTDGGTYSTTSETEHPYIVP